MNPYRNIEQIQQGIIAGPRWNVSFWTKLYVRIARSLFNIRNKYSYQREYKQYQRDLKRWYADKNSPFIPSKGIRRPHPFPPMPVPPSIHILE